ncbi:hypothetical protein [Actinoplanes teichomyceticus]|uniref:Uncharacterized protein n=1 Tax=Actinoplanes teichomyceticus TaxID=1867 RepID=A0A561WAG0_ACTTI|nr:hypothetical protein [Actinoplanes teichomyceticus]TWG20851.1 hypothetical protein FHX34_103380 [Actinoplanes teichomyceticus]GIF14512.1 hypothetical protein Ate01nite_45440 [Actinoplanes teichomyceticus]
MPLAHGVGGSADLPLPLDLVLQAGAATVVLSFLIAAAVWTRPRLAGHPQRPVRTAGKLPGLRMLVLVASLYLVADALAGPRSAANPAAHALFVWLWVGLVPLSALCGPVWRAVNPLRTVFRLLRLPRAGLRPGPGAGVWPGVLWLLAFVWFELVAPHRTDPVVVGCALLGYAAAQLAMAVLRGEEWFARGDCFEVYSELAGRLSPLRRRTPLSGLAAPFPAAYRGAAGPAAFVAVWWGSTVFDSASGSPAWAGFVQRTGHPALSATVALTLVCAGVFLAVRKAARGLDVTASLIPVAAGYTLAHYLSLLVVEGPRGLLLVIQQWGLAPGAAWAVVPLPPVIAGAQVTLILLGHVLGVIVAHDAALAAGARVTAGAPGPAARPMLATLADELPLVLFMIGCTWTGLLLLFVR